MRWESFYEELAFQHYLQHYSGTTRTTETPSICILKFDKKEEQEQTKLTVEKKNKKMEKYYVLMVKVFSIQQLLSVKKKLLHFGILKNEIRNVQIH